MHRNTLEIFVDSSDVAHRSARCVATAAREAISARGTFTILLAGGSTPRAVYELLARSGNDPNLAVEWSKVELFFGDERCVPPDHGESNFRMVHESLLRHVAIPEHSIHRMLGEIEPVESAVAYAELLTNRFPEKGVDVALLGMGDDGHTASLFPYSKVLAELDRPCVAEFIEKSTTGQSWRITTTAPFINRAERVVAMVTGSAKAERLREVLKGPRDPIRLPIQLIQPVHAPMLWLVDSAAAEWLNPT